METKPAGKLIPRGHGVSDCLLPLPNKPSTPEHLKKFRQRTKPDVGECRISHSATEQAQEMEHGKKTKASLNAGDLANPQPLTLFQASLVSRDEGIYASHIKNRLGKGPADAIFPSELDPQNQTFGLKTVKGDDAGSLVSPQKTKAQVDEESAVGKELYKRSHNNFDVGEMIDRDYDWSVFSKDSKYGVPTPHDNTGKQVHLAMDWQKGTQITSKQLDDFRERTHPQLGLVHDPIADSLNVNEDHTFGVMVESDEFNAGHLLHSLGDSIYLECKGFDKGLLSTIRNHLKKNKFYDFQFLLDGFKKHSSNDNIESSKARKLLFEFGVPLEPGMVDLLLHWCINSTNTDRVDYILLVEIINWKEELDISKVGEVINSNTLGTSVNGSMKHEQVITKDSYKTSSQQVQAVTGQIPTTGYRAFGTPTIRADRPPPRIRRVADNTNYGDESDAFGVMYPSIYSLFGVYEQDFFTPRQPDEVRQIFSSIGVTMNDEQFKTFWEKAASKDTNGQVSIESFRAVLEEDQTA